MNLTELTLPDGRSLELFVSGPADAVPLVVHHGTPGSYVKSPSLERAAHAAGLRWVSFSRPGYGGSTRLPGRTVASVVPDVEAVLDSLGAARALTIGHSGGGPHALATAALLPDRIAGAASVAGVGPYGVHDLDFLAGMGEDNVQEFDQALQGDAALRAFLEQVRPQMLDTTVEALIESMSSLLPDVDRAVLTGEVGQSILDSISTGIAPGVDGWMDDDLAFTQPWGFQLDAITVPVSIWQGEADLMVPFAHGQWLAAHVPGASAHLLAGEGHLSIGVGAAEQTVAELVATL